MADDAPPAGAADDRAAWIDRNRRLFRRYDLPAYRPPEFADGTPVTAVRRRLEARYDVHIDLRTLPDEPAGTRGVRVDGERVETVRCRRDADARTVYETTAGEFAAAVRSHLASDRVCRYSVQQLDR